MAFVPLSSSNQLVQTFLFALGSGANIVPYNKDDLCVTGPGRVILDANVQPDGRLHIKVGAGEFVFDDGLWNLGQTEEGGNWVLLKNTTFVNQFPGDPECLKFVFIFAKK